MDVIPRLDNLFGPNSVLMRSGVTCR
jgi:hypothetical protein